MSAASQPMSLDRFKAALPDLSLALLHAKAGELHNSIAHLQQSNAELEVEAADFECAAAISENEEVILRMRQRLSAVKNEVLSRGALWVWDGLDELARLHTSTKTVDPINGFNSTNLTAVPAVLDSSDQASNERVTAAVSVDAAANGYAEQSHESITAHGSGLLPDQVLAARVAERLQELDDDEEGGLHL